MQTAGFRSVPKFLICGAAAVISVCTVSGANADIRLFGAGGLSQHTPESGSTASSKALTGVNAKLAGHFDIFGPVPGISIYAGPEIQTGTSIREYDDAAALKAKETVKFNAAGLEAGVHVGLVPVVTLQAGVNYGFPTGGTKEVVKPTSTVTGKATKGSETGVTLRALITPFPLIRLGAEFSTGTGAVTHETHGEMKYSFWAARGVLGIAL
ncbi:MAG: hypothetical protein EBR09_08310 [Proteobacteria bacterium]|nr:hypothetical protein [Pseudomonadota bacterium]